MGRRGPCERVDVVRIASFGGEHSVCSRVDSDRAAGDRTQFESNSALHGLPGPELPQVLTEDERRQDDDPPDGRDREANRGHSAERAPGSESHEDARETEYEAESPDAGEHEEGQEGGRERARGDAGCRPEEGDGRDEEPWEEVGEHPDGAGPDEGRGGDQREARSSPDRVRPRSAARPRTPSGKPVPSRGSVHSSSSRPAYRRRRPGVAKRYCRRPPAAPSRERARPDTRTSRRHGRSSRGQEGRRPRTITSPSVSPAATSGAQDRPFRWDAEVQPGGTRQVRYEIGDHPGPRVFMTGGIHGTLVSLDVDLSPVELAGAPDGEPLPIAIAS